MPRPDHPTASAAQRFADETLQQIDGAHAVLVATVDGFPLAHAHRRDVDFVLVRAKSNLALARRKVVEVERELSF